MTVFLLEQAKKIFLRILQTDYKGRVIILQAPCKNITKAL
jgi:hypothetical protein